MKQPTISIIIVSYNVRDFLIDSLTSLQKALQDIDNEIFVIDNASLDSSVEDTISLFPDVKIVRNKNNVGFAKANNQALKQAKGKFIVLLNPDTIVQEDTFSVMLDFFEKKLEAGVAGCKILNSDGTLQLPCRRSFPTPWNAFSKLIGLSSLFPKTKLFGKYNLTYLDPDKTYEVEALSGSFFMFRKEVYDDIGGLDETFFMYGEDLDWMYRANKNNWKIFYVHSTQIIHYKGESTKRSDIDAITKFYEAMHLFVKKHYKSPSLVVPILRLGIFFRSLLAFSNKFWKNNFNLVIDFLMINALIFISEFIRFGKFHNFPEYAYPNIYIFPPLVFILASAFLGVYTKYKFSVSRSIISIFFAFLMLSSLTYFIKSYAFSRAVVLLLSTLAFFLLPGWRIVYRLFLKSNLAFFPFKHQRILGKRAIIVGFTEKDENFIIKLKSDFRKDYNIVGLLVKDSIKIGKEIKDIPVLGSIENLDGIIKKYEIEEVIFSTQGLNYTEILSVLIKNKHKSPIFRLIPQSAELMDNRQILSFENIDLVEIDLKINKFFNKLLKRSVDIFISSLLIIPVKLISIFNNNLNFKKCSDNLKDVFWGSKSIVGITEVQDSKESLKLGKVGIASLADINRKNAISDEEKIKLNIIYARNQSLSLDIEIAFKALIEYFRK